MKRAKLLMIFIIVLATVISIVYLIFQAKELEKYTLAPGDRGFSFILYSTSGGTLKDNTSVKGILSSCQKSLEGMGYEVQNLGIKTPDDARGSIMKVIKGNKRYVLLDVNATVSVINKNTLLIKTGSKDTVKYKDNMDQANTIKNHLKNSDMKVNILSDSKNSFNDDLGIIALRFEISKQNTSKEGTSVISNAIGGIIK